MAHSEGKLQNHFADARILRTRDLCVGSGTQARVRRIEVSVVHDVEELAAELQRAMFEAEILVRGDIENDQSGTANRSASAVSKESRRRLNERPAAKPV